MASRKTLDSRFTYPHEDDTFRLMFTHLTYEERLHLMKFVCSFAWADLKIRDEERNFVKNLIVRLGFEDDEERARIYKWIESPPPPEDVDPMNVPLKHREIFLQTCLSMMGADGELAEEERENYNLLSMLLR